MVASAGAEAPIAFMDTGPAAALGALHDPAVAAQPERRVHHFGNMHLLGFHLQGRRVASLFEHHTGEVSDEQIEAFSAGLADGSLTNEAVFQSKGHGAHHHDRSLVAPRIPAMVAVTGPQRHRTRATTLSAYFAAPFGDMMISGCFGLLRAYGEVFRDSEEHISAALGPLGD
jgi:uncharacterized protein (DUF1786 family)